MNNTNKLNSVVFKAHGITKVYNMGEVQVHALRGYETGRCP